LSPSRLFIALQLSMTRLYATIDSSIIKRVFGDVNRRENNKRKAVTDESRLLQPFFEKELCAICGIGNYFSLRFFSYRILDEVLLVHEGPDYDI